MVFRPHGDTQVGLLHGVSLFLPSYVLKELVAEQKGERLSARVGRAGGFLCVVIMFVCDETITARYL